MPFIADIKPSEVSKYINNNYILDRPLKLADGTLTKDSIIKVISSRGVYDFDGNWLISCTIDIGDNLFVTMLENEIRRLINVKCFRQVFTKD